jgi:hypothetical protein
MKTWLLTLLLATVAISTAQAEIYRPSVVRDTTILGAVAGALIGGHNNDHWAQGALIGAAAGAVIGTVVDDSRPRGYGYQECAVAPVVQVPCAPVATCAPTQVVYVQGVPRSRVVYVSPAPVVYSRRVVYVSRGNGDYRRDYRHDQRRDGRWND